MLLYTLILLLFFQLRQKIVEAHANVKDLNLLEAKVNFIKAWQSLPDYGVSLFVVRFHGEKKDELLGVASNKIMRMSLNNGDHLKTWRFSTMKVCVKVFYKKAVRTTFTFRSFSQINFCASLAFVISIA